MEASYGIGVQNRYALFLEDGEDDSVDPFNSFQNAGISTNVDPLASNESSMKKGSIQQQQQHQQQQSTKSSMNQKGHQQQKLSNNVNNRQQQQSATGTLTESKQQNVMANQKSDQGRPIRNNRQQGRQQQQSGGSNRENQENRIQRSPRNFESKEGGGDDFKTSKELRSEKDNHRRNGFARGGPRGGGRGGARYGKREFNRHSGSDRSGVKSMEKREGGGSHNWGKIDDFSEQPSNENDEMLNGEKMTENEKSAANEEGQNADETTGAGGETGDQSTGETETKNDEPQFKTLDEYKRELEEKRMHTQFNIRKPGEGEDKSKWKKTYVLKKKPVAEEEEVEYEEIEVEEDTSKRRNRQILDIEVSFRPAEGSRGGRVNTPRGGGGGSGGPREGNERRRNDGGERSGNRGGGGGGGRGSGRGGNRGGRDRNRYQPAPKFDDFNDFPSLTS